MKEPIPTAGYSLHVLRSRLVLYRDTTDGTVRATDLQQNKAIDVEPPTVLLRMDDRSRRTGHHFRSPCVTLSARANHPSQHHLADLT
jgi:hypothetical protein